jgi:hypothetical protein
MLRASGRRQECQLPDTLKREPQRTRRENKEDIFKQILFVFLFVFPRRSPWFPGYFVTLGAGSAFTGAGFDGSTSEEGATSPVCDPPVGIPDTGLAPESTFVSDPVDEILDKSVVSVSAIVLVCACVVSTGCFADFAISRASLLGYMNSNPVDSPGYHHV